MLAGIVSFYTSAYTSPAFPLKQKVVVDGDTITIQLKGDEHCKYALDEEGYTILSVGDEWRYAQMDKNGKAVPSSHKVTSLRNQAPSVRRFLQTVSKGLVPERRSFDISLDQIQNPAIGFRKVLVIMMQFADEKFTKGKEDYNRLFNEENYNEDGAKGSVHDYYQWVSYGQLNLQSDIMGPYTAQNNMVFYGGNTGTGGSDSNPFALFQEAINEAVKEIQLSDYDADGDGYVDNVHIIYAGYGEEAGASSNAIWAHEMTFSPITIQGMKINKYSCAPELRGYRGTGISRIGPHCHEIGHALGAMDYYDTNYETNGSYSGTGEWDVMAHGSWNDGGISPADFNPYVKTHDFGWTETKELRPNEYNTINPSSEKGNIYKVETGVKNDYFLLEYRDGKDFHSAEPGNGLLIFHIGPQLETKAQSNIINAAYPQQCYVVCASSTYKRPSSSSNSYGNVNSAGCPYPGASKNTSFTDDSTPAALTVSGQKTGITLTEIAVVGHEISLYCGDTGAEEPEPDSEPDTTSWSESFEKLTTLTNWISSQIEGEGAFSVVMKMSDDETAQSPKAVSGRGYLKYEPQSRISLTGNRVVASVTSPPIALTSGKDYSLTLYVRKYTSRSGSKNLLSLAMIDADNEAKPLLQDYIVIQQEAWEKVSLEIPEKLSRFSLLIKCDNDSGSRTFVDDIRIIEKADATPIWSLSIEEIAKQSEYIFNVLGEKIPALQKGLNIIKKPSGEYRKVYFK